MLQRAAVAEEDGGLRESEVVQPSDLQDVVVVQPMDCRAVFPVPQIDSEVLSGFNYSAIGWDLDPAEDPSRTVTITAQAGKLAKGVFTPDGSAAVVLRPHAGAKGWEVFYGCGSWTPRVLRALADRAGVRTFCSPEAVGNVALFAGEDCVAVQAHEAGEYEIADWSGRTHRLKLARGEVKVLDTEGN